MKAEHQIRLFVSLMAMNASHVVVEDALDFTDIVHHWLDACHWRRSVSCLQRLIPYHFLDRAHARDCSFLMDKWEVTVQLKHSTVPIAPVGSYAKPLGSLLRTSADSSI